METLGNYTYLYGYTYVYSSNHRPLHSARPALLINFQRIFISGWFGRYEAEYAGKCGWVLAM